MKRFELDGHQPLYMQLAEKLKSEMESGTLKTGEQMEPEESLAKELKISRITVRAAFKRLEAEGYLLRLRGKGTFATLPQSRERRLLIVSEQLPGGNRNIHSLLAGMVTRAQRDGAKLQVVTKGEIRDILPTLRNNERFMTGVLFMRNNSFDKAVLDGLDKAKTPWLVEGDGHPEGSAFVDLDNEKPVARMLDHLISLDHRRIALISLSCGTNRHLAQRHEAAQRHLERSLGAAPGKPYCEVLPLERRDEAAAVALKMMALKSPPSAIVCNDDTTAAKIVIALQEAGHSVPGEVSVTGFDGIVEYEQILRPRLTTARIDYFELGFKAADALLSMMGGAKARRSGIHVEPELLIRESSGPAKK